jgi:hypothetical protein
MYFSIPNIERNFPQAFVNIYNKRAKLTITPKPMNVLIDQIIRLLTIVITGSRKRRQEAIDQFTVFVKDQLSYLMEQVKAFQEDYIHVSRQLNELHSELRGLNAELTRMGCHKAATCPERN